MTLGTWQRERYVRRSPPGSPPSSPASPPRDAGAAPAHRAGGAAEAGGEPPAAAGSPPGCWPSSVRPPPGRWSGCAGAPGGGPRAEPRLGWAGAAAAAEQSPAQQPLAEQAAAPVPPGLAADRIVPPPGLAAFGQAVQVDSSATLNLPSFLEKYFFEEHAVEQLPHMQIQHEAANGMPSPAPAGNAEHGAARPCLGTAHGAPLCMAPPGLEHIGHAGPAAPAPGRALEFLGGLGACLPGGVPGAAAADRRDPGAGCAELPPGIFDFGVCLKPEQKATGVAEQAGGRGEGKSRRVSVQRRQAPGAPCPAQGTAQASPRAHGQRTLGLAPQPGASDGGTFLGLESNVSINLASATGRLWPQQTGLAAQRGWSPFEESPAEEKLRNAGLLARDLLLCSPAKLPPTVPGVAGAPPTAATPTRSAAKAGARAVLWCAESTTECGASVKERCRGLLDDMGEQAQALEHFEFPVVSMFQRWMFQQERGTDVAPWAILVVGWREAQPCVNHVEAAATEDFAGLRQDAQRHLRAATGDPASGEVRVAVSTAIIVVESWLQHARAASWIARKVSGKGATRPCPVSIVLAHGRDDLRSAILAAAAIEGPRDAGALKADTDVELGVPKHIKCFDTADSDAVEVGCA